MTSAQSFGQYLAGLPGVVLAVLSYLLIIRLVIDLVFPNANANLPFRVVRRVTNPLVHAVGAVTPRVVPGALVTLCAVVWVFALRIALVQVMAVLAMRRTLG